ncbi:MAG: hypothetical protein AB1938_02870 [Myxococcota bacterium]
MAWEKTTLRRMDPTLRAELEGLLAAPSSAFESDYQDMLALWLFFLVGSAVGLVASIWDLATGSLPEAEELQFFLMYPTSFLTTPSILGVPVSLAVGAWATVQMVRCKGRCGYAALDTALAVVRGRKVKLLRYADIASADTTVIRTRKQTFTSLTLRLKSGRTTSLNSTGRWVAQAVQRIQRGR